MAHGAPDRGRRPTVAVLIDHMDLFGGGYEAELRDAIEAVGCELDLDLLLMYGRHMSHPDAAHATHNRIYDLVHPDRVDGLVTLSPSLAVVTGPAGLERLFERCGIRARCSAGLIVEGTPSIVIDNSLGMTAIVDHILDHHGHRRVAFIGGIPGNVDAEVRLEVYKQGLQQRGLPFDHKLVGTGDFIRRSGEVAMLEILRRAGTPEAVVVANDGMALGAIAALQRHGLQVPDDVAVTGFDDLAMARLGDPPLTTVAQPFQAMLGLAVRSVAAQIRGETVDTVLRMPAEVVLRHSCGCNGALDGHGLPGSSRFAPNNPQAYIDEHASRIVRGFIGAYSNQRARAADMRCLLAALRRELDGEGGSFVSAVKEILATIGRDNERRQDLQLAITRLRDELRPIRTPHLENLFHDSRSQVALTDTRAQVQQRLEIDQAYSLLMEKGEEFSNALDLMGLAQGLYRALPALGMNTASVSIYPPNDNQQLQPLVCIRDGHPVNLGGQPFAARMLVPTGVFSEERRRTLLVFPLVLKDRCLGVAAFDYVRGANGYVVVRDRISVALGGVELHQAILESATAHERSIQEQQRLANEARVRALNVLAGGVAHDLNNSLGPLVALPDIILAELDHLEHSGASVAPALRLDLKSIKSSALRAAQTIKDLLAMSRQSRAAKEVIDLNQIVQNMLSDSVQRSMWAAPGLNVKLALHGRPLLVSASEDHLRRAIENLLHNAADAMSGRGTLTVGTHECSLSMAEAAREGVPNGVYVVLTVSDTGTGITAEDLPHIFEPFFSSKQLSDRSGSGLGLAIVEGVVRDHAGFIKVQSSAGQGTSFTLHFPAQKPAPKRKDSSKILLRGTGRILVVDDEPAQLRTAQRLLKHFGYDVETASSGASAFEKVEQHPFDVVILDMLLNESDDGIQLYRRIQALYPRQRAIITSGHAPPDRAELALSEGLVWLPKPYTAGALADAVRSTIGAS